MLCAPQTAAWGTLGTLRTFLSFSVDKDVQRLLTAITGQGEVRGRAGSSPGWVHSGCPGPGSVSPPPPQCPSERSLSVSARQMRTRGLERRRRLSRATQFPQGSWELSASV